MMTHKESDVMERLLLSDRIKDYVIEEGPDVSYFIVQKHNEGWVPLQTWLDKQEETVH
tara:strand:- start:2242 stop:2415 length:174 start_codon:yes stop_codon:yes gene_type:complete